MRLSEISQPYSTFVLLRQPNCFTKVGARAAALPETRFWPWPLRPFDLTFSGKYDTRFVTAFHTASGNAANDQHFPSRPKSPVELSKEIP